MWIIENQKHRINCIKKRAVCKVHIKPVKHYF